MDMIVYGFMSWFLDEEAPLTGPEAVPDTAGNREIPNGIGEDRGVSGAETRVLQFGPRSHLPAGGTEPFGEPAPVA